jgi:hypothetical protein
MTQTLVAERLGISQQTLAHYQVGRLQVAVSTLVPSSGILSCFIDELVYGEKANKGQSKRCPASRLQRQVEKVRQLALTKQQFVIEMLDAVIQQASH